MAKPLPVVSELILWGSSDPDTWQPPYRSWPSRPSALEILAWRAGLDDERLRELLRREIARRRPT